MKRSFGERGAYATEFACAVALVALASLTSIAQVGGASRGTFYAASNAMTGLPTAQFLKDVNAPSPEMGGGQTMGSIGAEHDGTNPGGVDIDSLPDEEPKESTGASANASQEGPRTHSPFSRS